MPLKYQCCYCSDKFLADEAIDGYGKGYKVGFLCPKCGKNVQAGFQAKPKISPEQYKWTFIAFVLFLPAVLTLNHEAEYKILGILLSLNTWCFLFWIVFIAILFVKKPALFLSTTIITEPVNNA